MKKMKKLIVFLVLCAFTLFYFNIESVLDQQAAYLKFVEEHPFSKTMNLSKKERKSLGLPPNAYYEQEYLNEMNPTTGRTHPENIIELQNQLNSYRSRVPGDAADNPWIERGPNNVGGRTRAILFDPNDATNKRVFAGGVSGGLWVNNDITDPNTSWQQVGVSENLSVTCITLDPNNSQIMYIGTGESQTGSGVSGNGVWKSTDGGFSWTNIFSDSFNPDLSDRLFYINDIKAWNNNGVTEVFIGVAGAYDGFRDFPGTNTTGLYKSIDNGETWSKLILPPIPNISFGSPASVYEPNDIEIASDNSIWIGSEKNIYGYGGGTILKSTNGSVFSVQHTIDNAGRIEIALSSTDSAKLFVLAEGTTSTTPIIMQKTEDAFATTTAMALPNDADSGIPFNDFTRGQAGYDLVLEIDPTNDAILYAGGIDLFRSSDSGAIWTQMSKWSNNNLLRSKNIPLVHADQHALVFHPTDSDKAVIGNDGGVFFASSLTKATQSTIPNDYIEARNKDYNIIQFYNGAISQDVTSDVLIAGSQDNGTQFIDGATNNSSNPSLEVYGGDGAYTFIDKDGEYMIVSYVYNNKALLQLPYTGSGKTLDNDSSTGSFVNPQDLDDNLDILYANAHSSSQNFDSIVRYQGIKTTEALVKDRIGNFNMDNKATVVKVSPFQTTSTTLFLGLANGKILKVENANSENPTWRTLKRFNGSVSSIRFGNDENEILATIHNYGVQSIWSSNNGGTSWMSKEGDFPDIPVKDILMNPLNNDQVIIATQLGVWATYNFKDDAPTWMQTNNGMSSVKVTSLDLRIADNTILASTFGRGMFTGKFTAATASIDDVLVNNNAVTIYPTVSNGNFTIVAKTKLGVTKVTIFDINGKQVYKRTLDFTTTDKQQVSVNLNTGVYMVNVMDENNRKTSSKIIIEQ
jgi:hypothetical protein